MSRIKMDLQFFADDSQEKTEKATPRKREEVRKKGQVAKSSEVTTALILLFVFILLYFAGGWMTSTFISLFEKSYFEYAQWEITEQNVAVLFQEISFDAALAVAPVMVVALAAGVFGNYVQIGFLFSTDPLKVKWERINPLKGFKRIFSTRALVEFLKSMLKILLIGTIVFGMLWIRREDLFILSQKNVGAAFSMIASLTFQIGLSVALTLLFLSVLDYWYQKYDFEKQNRMSKQEVKDEHKKTEGDPLIRSKIKERQRQMAMKRMMQEIPKADVVITNPTHYAVALQYEKDQMDAPVVLAKGKDYLAQKIKEIAEKHEIVVMENKFLARTLYAQVDIGEAIPEHLFKAVAEVLAYVYRLQGKV